MTKETQTTNTIKTDEQLYAEQTAGIADLPDDVEFTSSGDSLITFANARPGWQYYLMDGLSKEAVQADFESHYKPDKWVRAASIGHGNVHTPREGAYSMVICIKSEEYQKRVWAKRLAHEKTNNEAFGIVGVPGGSRKDHKIVPHQEGSRTAEPVTF